VWKPLRWTAVYKKNQLKLKGFGGQESDNLFFFCPPFFFFASILFGRWTQQEKRLEIKG
jgi:hypothetical protein